MQNKSISGAKDYAEISKNQFEQARKAPEPTPQVERVKIMDTSNGDINKKQIKSKINTNLRSKTVHG